MLIWLASYPRSGNTMARHVIETCYDLPTWTQYPEYDIDQVVHGDRHKPDALLRAPAG